VPAGGPFPTQKPSSDFPCGAITAREKTGHCLNSAGPFSTDRIFGEAKMLMRVSPTTSDVRPIRPRQDPAIITTDRYLKGAWHSKHARAGAAAREVCGITGGDVRPTIAAAARTYRVSEYLVRQAVNRIRRSKVAVIKPVAAVPSIDAVWMNTPPTDRDRFVEKNMVELWTLFDRVTAKPEIAA
jgi:hypothetical protein